MIEDDKQQGLEHGLEGQLECAYCLKNVPTSEAYQPEGEEYTMYFCGLECYSAWRRQAAEKSEGDREGD
jgi:hypothetical protein